jgi:hypothetical protein
MRDEPLDPRIDRMMAALYGELSESEERAFERLLEKDDALRAEFEELRETRAILGGWEIEERVPSFVLVDEPAAAERSERRSPASGWRERVAGFFRPLFARPAWGLATAAVALLVLAVGGFRVERVDGGVAFRFGEPTAPPTTALDDLPLGPGRSLDGPSGSGAAKGGDGAVVPVAGYVTKRELDDRDAEMMVSLASLLNDYGERRDEEMADLLLNYYRDTRDRQDSDYRDLQRRIDALGYQFLRSTGNAPPLDESLGGGDDDRSRSLDSTPNGETEEE